MKKHFLVFAIILAATPLFSQNYKTGIGLRGGWISGITFKHFVKESRAVEMILSPGYGWGRYYDGFQVIGLYELHKQAFDVDGLFWLYGGGIHISQGHYEKVEKSYWVSTGPGNSGYWVYDTKRYSYFGFGIDGIFGIEYKISEIPITLGFDVKPFIEIGNNNFSWLYWDSALSIRFVF
jgi:hypothetical protein